MFNCLRDHDVLTSLQHDFIPGDPKVNQLVDIFNTFCKAICEGKDVHAVFYSKSKAFDRVWHKDLLYKLQTVGITEILLMWFKIENRE